MSSSSQIRPTQVCWTTKSCSQQRLVWASAANHRLCSRCRLSWASSLFLCRCRRSPCWTDSLEKVGYVCWFYCLDIVLRLFAHCLANNLHSAQSSELWKCHKIINVFMWDCNPWFSLDYFISWNLGLVSYLNRFCCLNLLFPSKVQNYVSPHFMSSTNRLFLISHILFRDRVLGRF